MSDNDIKCEICTIQYDLQNFVPICIPCGHTMCFPCLRDKYKKHGKIICNKDEKTFSLKPDLYAKNYYIIKLLQNKKLSNSNNSRNSKSNTYVSTEENLNSFRNSRTNTTKNSFISDYDEILYDKEKSKNINSFNYQSSNTSKDIKNCNILDAKSRLDFKMNGISI